MARDVTAGLRSISESAAGMEVHAVQAQGAQQPAVELSKSIKEGAVIRIECGSSLEGTIRPHLGGMPGVAKKTAWKKT